MPSERRSPASAPDEQFGVPLKVELPQHRPIRREQPFLGCALCILILYITSLFLPWEGTHYPGFFFVFWLPFLLTLDPPSGLLQTALGWLFWAANPLFWAGTFCLTDYRKGQERRAAVLGSLAALSSVGALIWIRVLYHDFRIINLGFYLCEVSFILLAVFGWIRVF
jgi:hypothetical protein